MWLDDELEKQDTDRTADTTAYRPKRTLAKPRSDSGECRHTE